MKSVGEAMAIGRTFNESLQKAMRSLETGSFGFEPKVDLSEEKRQASLEIVRRKLQAAQRAAPLVCGRCFPTRHVGRRNLSVVGHRSVVSRKDSRNRRDGCGDAEQYAATPRSSMPESCGAGSRWASRMRVSPSSSVATKRNFATRRKAREWRRFSIPSTPAARSFKRSRRICIRLMKARMSPSRRREKRS